MTNELTHHGIEGMRWGVRRYQNKDGSLTKLGEKRYARDIEQNEKKKKDNRLPENALNDPNRWVKEDDTRIKGVAESGKRLTDSLSSFERVIPEKRSNERINLSSMSDKELRDKINRELLEKQYNDIFNPVQVSRGRENVRNALEIGGSVLGVTASALGIALAIRELKG